jgi:hypothetical protein
VLAGANGVKNWNIPKERVYTPFHYEISTVNGSTHQKLKMHDGVIKNPELISPLYLDGALSSGEKIATSTKLSPNGNR